VAFARPEAQARGLSRAQGLVEEIAALEADLFSTLRSLVGKGG
jgi:hypothetical protein